jgi:hypothetical protein
VARALRGGGHDPSADELREVERAFGANLEPVHPGTADAALASSWTLDVSDPVRAAEAAERLRALDSVEAAYVKPAEEPPGP